VTFTNSRQAKQLSESISNLGAVSKNIEALQAKSSSSLDDLRKSIDDSAAGKPETPQVIFAIMNHSGLAYRFPEMVASSHELSYWGAGVFLMDAFLADEPNRSKYIAAMQALVDTPEMAPSSRGFDLYLLGKMEQFRGQNERAARWFDKCRERAPQMYEFLMAQDSAYDLKSVPEYMVRRHAN